MTRVEDEAPGGHVRPQDLPEGSGLSAGTCPRFSAANSAALCTDEAGGRRYGTSPPGGAIAGHGPPPARGARASPSALLSTSAPAPLLSVWLTSRRAPALGLGTKP